MAPFLSRIILRTLFVGVFLSMLICCMADETFAVENLLTNGDFEQGLDGWDKPWSRDGEITAKVSGAEKHDGKQSLRIEYKGSKDWSLACKQRLEVKPGEIFRLSAWVRVEGDGTVSPSVVLYDEKHQAIDWTYGGTVLKATGGWQRFDRHFAIPDGAKWMWPRVVGYGPGTVDVDALSLVRAGDLQRNESFSTASPTLENDLVRLRFFPKDGSCLLHDKRTGETWRQVGAASKGKLNSFVMVKDVKQVADGIKAKLIDPENLLEFSATWSLVPNVAEACVELEGTGSLNSDVQYPYPFVSAKERKHDSLIMPVNEGMSYPIDDETLDPVWYCMFGGHGLCMGWYGVADLSVDTKAENSGDGLMTIVETPNDAAVYTQRKEGRLCLEPKWLPEKGEFGPKRKMRYILFDKGGYVAMCKRYRAYAKKIGLFKTLAEKRKANPDVDMLIGAVNVWCWGSEPAAKCKELQSLGIDRILWSNQSKPDAIRRMNELGVLTSRYDIYQDCMNPEHFPKLSYISDAWTSDRWPDGIIIDKSGDWSRGWGVKGKDGKTFYPCGRLCDRFAPDYARRRVAESLKTHPYHCRFIDTTTASPWAECYSPDHPMTRTESRRFRMELLDVMSREFKLVTGSETGHDAAVPYVHYFEGMLSLGPYRVPDSGRDMMRPWNEVPDRVAKFQTGHRYRLPLWELVYHDCVVAQWYWGDYNNKLPSLWDRRDLFNLLYNTPPMFMFNKSIWKEHKDRFVQSYKTTHASPHDTGYAEMVSHRWLTRDHAVQQAKFSNGVCVTVNFGEEVYETADGKRIESLGYLVEKFITTKDTKKHERKE